MSEVPLYERKGQVAIISSAIALGGNAVPPPPSIRNRNPPSRAPLGP